MFFPSKHVSGGTATGGLLSWHACPDHYTGFSCLNMPGSVTMWALATVRVVMLSRHGSIVACPGPVGEGRLVDLSWHAWLFSSRWWAVLFVVTCPMSTMAHQGISWLIGSVATHADPDATHPVIICGVLSWHVQTCLGFWQIRKLRPEQGLVGHMISKHRKSNRNPQAAESGLPMNVAPLVVPGGTNPAVYSRCPKWSRWSQSMQSSCRYSWLPHTRHLPFSTLETLQSSILHFSYLPATPDTPRDITAFLGMSSAPPSGRPGPKLQSLAIMDVQAHMWLFNPTAFWSRVSPSMLRSKPSSWGTDDPHTSFVPRVLQFQVYQMPTMTEHLIFM